MIFPIGDEQVVGGHKPYLTFLFLAINTLVFLLQLSQPGALICEFGTIPNDIINGKGYITLLTSMFMHGGWMHLIGNMLFLWVFADNIEATIGNLNFLFFYLMGGLVASAVHIYFNMGAEMSNCCMPCGDIECTGNLSACVGSIPSVGASGAIAAVLGAYLVMFPLSKIRVLVIFFFRSFYIPAILFLGFWILMQLASGMASVGPMTADTSGVAWWAHIGGFFFGVLSGFFGREKRHEFI